MVAGLARRCARRASKPCSLPSGLSRGARPYFLLALLEVTRGGVFWIVAVGPAKWAIRALRLLDMGFLSVGTRRAATVAGNKTGKPARAPSYWTRRNRGLFGRLARRSRRSQESDQLLRRHDVGEQGRHVVEGGVVLRIGVGGIAISDKDHLVVHLHRVARRRFAAHIGGRAGDDEGVDPARLQDLVQLGRSRHEGAKPGLVDDQVCGRHLQARPKLEAVASFAERRL